MNEPSPRSRYWLSPGIDVPAEEEVSVLSASPRALRGFYYDRNAGESLHEFQGSSRMHIVCFNHPDHRVCFHTLCTP